MLGNIYREFREFAVRGNVVDMAVGIVIGAGLAAIAKSIVDNLLMPPVGLATGGVDFQDLFIVIADGKPAAPYSTLAAAQAAGAVTMNYGLVINSILSFFLVALAAFVLVRGVNRLRREQKDPTTPPVESHSRTCPFCIAEVAEAATRCGHCTSELPPRSQTGAVLGSAPQ